MPRWTSIGVTIQSQLSTEDELDSMSIDIDMALTSSSSISRLSMDEIL